MEYHLTTHTLHFEKPAGTSAGFLKSKTSYFIQTRLHGKKGIGEVAPLHWLSPEYCPDMQQQINRASGYLLGLFLDSNQFKQFGAMKPLQQLDRLGKVWPIANTPASVRFGWECAILSAANGQGHSGFVFNNPKRKPVPINGLIWMAQPENMLQQGLQKFKQGYNCLKMKIGAADFDKELWVIEQLKKQINHPNLVVRVDANGAFAPSEALEKLTALWQLGVHSIEQPIKPGQPQTMATLVANAPLPIALDEELIEHSTAPQAQKKKLLETIKPNYIILKPTLHGGLSGVYQWVQVAQQLGIGWWLTSALEASPGLAAIYDLSLALKAKGPQGLGTGSLFTNNLPPVVQAANGFVNVV